MAQSVLSKLVKTDEETKENLSSIKTTLNKIYKLQSQEAKLKEQRYKREQQDKKRAKGDSLAKTLADKIVGDKKGKKGGLLGMIMGAFGKLGGLLGMISLPLLLKALGIGAIGAAIIGYIGSEKFRKFVNDYILIPLGKAVMAGAKAIFDAAVKKFTEPLEPLSKGLYDHTYGQIKTKQGVIRGKELGQAALDREAAFYRGEGSWADVEAVADAARALQKRKYWNDRLAEEKQRIAKKQAQIDEEENEQERALLEKELAAMKKYEANYQKKLIEKEKIAREKIEALNLDDKYFNKKQTGGPITVPGIGSGDKVPMMLPPGSFVLNRNAAGYQMGGIPTLLEPGEAVYGPGQWGMREFLLNKAVPRFQEGGEVAEGGKFEYPLPKGHTGTAPYQVFGAPRDGGNRKHAGVDIVETAPWGSDPKLPVVAPKDGVVSQERYTTSGYTAGMILKQNDGYDTRYVHMTPEVSPGTKVKAGDRIGKLIDLKNNSHLHFELYKSGSHTALNPAGYLASAGRTPGAGATLPGMHDSPDGPKGEQSGGDVTVKQSATNPFESFLNSIGEITGPVGQVLTGVAGAFQEVFAEELGSLGKFLFGGFGLSGGGGGDDAPTDAPSGPVEPLTGDNMSKAKQMYDYIKSKGYTSNQAKGLVANIERESTFNPRARSGDDGGPGGLFQWKGKRQKPKVRQLVESGDWKGQIDYALSEPEEWSATAYKNDTKNMSAVEAANWWAEHWERPQSMTNARNKHAQFIPRYQFQNGGVVNMRGTSSNSNLRQASEKQFIDQLAAAVRPVVVPMPVGGGGGGAGSGSIPIGPQGEPPSISAYPSNEVALDLSYRLSMGASFS